MPKNKKPPYLLLSGEEVAGVTTILNIHNVEPLKWWANKIGKQGIDLRELLDEKANIGILTHSMVSNYFSGKGVIVNDYPQEAGLCFLKFRDWLEKYKSIEPIAIEQQFVSEVFKFGGTPDFYGKIDGALTLIDFKTSADTYETHIFQLGAYYMLLKENKKYVNRAGIVNLPIKGKTAKETFFNVATLEVGFKIFQHCLEIYQLKRRIK